MVKGSESVVLSVCEGERDLGVFVDSQLSFKEHISQVVTKSNRLLGLIRRTFVNLDADSVKLLFKGVIRPILEYGQAAWSPYKLCEQRRLESVQRRATKLVPDIKNLSYTDRLRYLKLPSLCHRRKRGDMIDVYKYLHGYYDTGSELFCLNNSGKTRGHSLKLEKRFSRLDVRKFFFANRVIDVWNSLPEDVVTAGSVNAFKNRLDKHWEKIAFDFV